MSKHYISHIHINKCSVLGHTSCAYTYFIICSCIGPFYVIETNHMISNVLSIRLWTMPMVMQQYQKISSPVEQKASLQLGIERNKERARFILPIDEIMNETRMNNDLL